MHVIRTKPTLELLSKKQFIRLLSVNKHCRLTARELLVLSAAGRNKSQIRRLTGLSREGIGAAVQRLARADLVEKDGHKIIAVGNPEGLVSTANGRGYSKFYVPSPTNPLSTAQRIMLARLWSLMNDDGVASTTDSGLATLCRVERKTVARGLIKMEQLGLLKKQERDKRGRYLITMSPVAQEIATWFVDRTKEPTVVKRAERKRNDSWQDWWIKAIEDDMLTEEQVDRLVGVMEPDYLRDELGRVGKVFYKVLENARYPDEIRNNLCYFSDFFNKKQQAAITIPDWRGSSCNLMLKDLSDYLGSLDRRPVKSIGYDFGEVVEMKPAIEIRSEELIGLVNCGEDDVKIWNAASNSCGCQAIITGAVGRALHLAQELSQLPVDAGVFESLMMEALENMKMSDGGPAYGKRTAEYFRQALERMRGRS